MHTTHHGDDAAVCFPAGRVRVHLPDGDVPPRHRRRAAFAAAAGGPRPPLHRPPGHPRPAGALQGAAPSGGGQAGTAPRRGRAAAAAAPPTPQGARLPPGACYFDSPELYPMVYNLAYLCVYYSAPPDAEHRPAPCLPSPQVLEYSEVKPQKLEALERALHAYTTWQSQVDNTSADSYRLPDKRDPKELELECHVSQAIEEARKLFEKRVEFMENERAEHLKERELAATDEAQKAAAQVYSSPPLARLVTSEYIPRLPSRDWLVTSLLQAANETRKLRVSIQRHADYQNPKGTLGPRPPVDFFHVEEGSTALRTISGQKARTLPPRCMNLPAKKPPAPLLRVTPEETTRAGRAAHNPPAKTTHRQTGQPYTSSLVYDPDNTVRTGAQHRSSEVGRSYSTQGGSYLGETYEVVSTFASACTAPVQSACKAAIRPPPGPLECTHGERMARPRLKPYNNLACLFGPLLTPSLTLVPAPPLSPPGPDRGELPRRAGDGVRVHDGRDPGQAARAAGGAGAGRHGQASQAPCGERAAHVPAGGGDAGAQLEVPRGGGRGEAPAKDLRHRAAQDARHAQAGPQSRYSLPFRDWFPLRVYSLSPSAIEHRLR
eukprot:1190774-Prorocentrum_minimum.AAC.2